MRSRRMKTAGLVVVCCALLGAAVPAAAAAASDPVPCTNRVVSKVFAPWGDTADYFLLENGGFESGSAGWTLAGGASVVSGNETYFVRSATDAFSLSLPKGGSATSRPHCISEADENLRFFVRSTGPSWSMLRIDATFQSASGSTTFTNIATAAGASWVPTQSLSFGLTPEQVLGQSVTVQFKFTAIAGAWQMDDVYVDPIKGR